MSDAARDKPDAGVQSGAVPRPAGGAWAWGRIALQVVGFVLGAALLVWAVRSAFAKPEQRAQLEKLLDLPWWQPALLAGLSALAVVLDGLTFRAVLWPVHRLRRRDIACVSGVCAGLSYLPFKMSLLFRVLYHSRRDALSVFTIGAWVAATGAVLLASLVPILVASLAAHGTGGGGSGVSGSGGGALWWAIALGGMAALSLGGHALARALDRPGAHAWIAARTGGNGALSRVLRGNAFTRAYAGVHMVASPRAFWSATLYRVMILGAQGARFALAASFLGVPITPEQALLAGSAYNLIQAVAPTGVGGVREWGTSGALALASSGDLLAVVLVVSAIEAATNLAMALIGGAALRVDRLWVGHSPPAPPAPAHAGTP